MLHVIVPVPYNSFDRTFQNTHPEELYVSFDWLMRWVMHHWPMILGYGGMVPDFALLDAIDEQIRCSTWDHLEQDRALDALETHSVQIVKWAEEIYETLYPHLRTLPLGKAGVVILEDFEVAPHGTDATLISILTTPEGVRD